MTLTEIAKLLKDAKFPEAVFGQDDARNRYKELAKMCHPDLQPDDKRTMATIVFMSLQTHWGNAEKKIAENRYGDCKPMVQLRVTWRHGALSITGIIRKTALFKYLEATVEGTTQERILKLAKSTGRAAAENEIKLLKILNKARPVGATDGYSPWPAMIDSFQMPVGKGVRLPAILIQPPKPEDLVPLTDVLSAYPAGLDPRDMVWMINRLLLIIQKANEAGVVHGGLNPSNVYISPEQHLAYVDGWHYGTSQGSIVSGYDTDWSAFAAPEVKKKLPVDNTTDLFAVGVIAAALLNNGKAVVPKPIAGLLRALCLGPRQRPFADALELHSDLASVFEKLYGPRKFRPFSLTPTN